MPVSSKISFNYSARFDTVEKKHPIKKIRDDIFYLLVLGLINILRITPRKPALFFMRLLGRIAYRFSKGPRERAIEHLSLVYPEKDAKEISSLAGKVFVHFATTIGDLVRMPQLISSGLNDLVTASGTEYLDQAYSTGRGILLITCHFGNWELLGARLVNNGYPMSSCEFVNKINAASNVEAPSDTCAWRRYRTTIAIQSGLATPRGKYVH